jgi:hypothetical protein
MPMVRLPVTCALCAVSSYISTNVPYGVGVPNGLPFICKDCSQRNEEDRPAPIFRARPQSHEIPGVEGFSWDEKRDQMWVPNGFQERKSRRPKKVVPIWMNDPRELHHIVYSHSQSEVFGEDW